MLLYSENPHSQDMEATEVGTHVCRFKVIHFRGRFVERVWVLGSLISPPLLRPPASVSTSPFPEWAWTLILGQKKDLRVLGEETQGLF